jgi:hypothetical protein
VSTIGELEDGSDDDGSACDEKEEEMHILNTEYLYYSW